MIKMSLGNKKLKETKSQPHDIKHHSQNIFKIVQE